MMTDNSYTPMDTDSRAFMKIAGDGVQFSDEQTKFFRSLFYAGASAAVGFIKKRPLSQGELTDELADYADKLSADYEAMTRNN